MGFLNHLPSFERRDSTAVDGGSQEAPLPPAPSVVVSSAPTGTLRSSVQRPPRGLGSNPSGVPLFPAYGSGREFDPLHFDEEGQKLERNFIATLRSREGSVASDHYSVDYRRVSPPGGDEQPLLVRAYNQYEERQKEYRQKAYHDLPFEEDSLYNEEGGRRVQRQSTVPQPQDDQGGPTPSDKTSSQRIGRKAPREVHTPRDRRPRGAPPVGTAFTNESFL